MSETGTKRPIETDEENQNTKRAKAEQNSDTVPAEEPTKKIIQTGIYKGQEDGELDKIGDLPVMKSEAYLAYVILGEQLFSAKYDVNHGRPLSWTADIGNLYPLPQEKEDLPEFIGNLTKTASSGRFGGWELQVLLTGMAQHKWSTTLLFLIEKSVREKACHGVGDWISHALREKRTFVRKSRHRDDILVIQNAHLFS